MKKRIFLLLCAMAVFAVCLFAACDDEGSDVGGNEEPQTYTVTFKADGEAVGTVNFTVGDKSITEPDVPRKQCYAGEWESYTLGDGDITVNAVYNVSHTALIRVDRVEPKCNQKGNTEYYSCADCGKYFSDSEGKAEIADKESVGLGEVDCSFDTDGSCIWCQSKKSDGLQYALSEDGNYYTVTGIGAFTGAELVIPSEYNGKPVSKIGDKAFYNQSDITSVKIPNSVTDIGKEAFYWCNKLKSVRIGSGVKSIGDDAFYHCRFESIIIPSNVTSIGDSAFMMCMSLTSVTIEKGVKSIGKSAFESCDKITGIIIPDSVTHIGDHAFSYCEGLTGMTLPSSVQSIGSRAFQNCEGLTSVSIPSGAIDEGAFQRCKGLTSLVLGSGVTSIGNYAFCECTSLETVTIENGVSSIGYGVFKDCNALTSVSVPDSVKSIGEYAFAYCSKLPSIDIGCGVEAIGKCAFRGCTLLTEINVSNENKTYRSVDGNVYGINDDAVTLVVYAGGKTDTHFTVPSDVTSIGEYAFIGCENLTSVTLGDGVKYIGSYAFRGCTALKTVTVGSGAEYIFPDAFTDCTEITVNYRGTEEQWKRITRNPDNVKTVNYNYTDE